MQKKFLSNILLLIVLNLLVKPIAIFGIDAAVQNRVGNEEYGLYFALLNIAFVFNILLDLGINNFTTRNVAQYPKIAPKYLERIIGFRFVLFVLYCIVTVGFAVLVDYELRAIHLLLFLILNQFFVTLIAYARSHFSGLLLFKTDALFSILDKLLLIFLCGSVLYFTTWGEAFQIEWFIYMQTICYGISFLFASTLLVRQIGKPKISIKLNFSRAILRQSLPYALLIFLMMLYTRTDSIMLERLHENGELESGIYAQGFRLLDAVFMFGMLFVNLLYPIFSNRLKHARDEVEDLMKMSGKILIWGAVALAFFVWWNATEILGWIYTGNIQPTVPVFQLLMITFIGMCITLIYGTLLTASGKLKILNRISTIGVTLNIVLNLILIPKMGALGAAITTLFTQFIVAIIQLIIVHKTFQFKVHLAEGIQFVLYFCIIAIGTYFLEGFELSIIYHLLLIVSVILFFKVLPLQQLKEIIQERIR